jgi:hypothetical protein
LWFRGQIERTIGRILSILAFLLPDPLPFLPHEKNRLGAGLFEFAPGVDDLVGGVDVLPIHQSMYWRVVELVIKDSSSPVLNSILHSGDDNDHNQWHG